MVSRESHGAEVGYNLEPKYLFCLGFLHMLYTALHVHKLQRKKQYVE